MCLVQLVGKLLCPVILKMGADDSELRTAVLKLISLLNTRIKASPGLKLPAEELVKVFRENCGSPLIANVALMELVMALERCTTADLRSLVRIGPPSLVNPRYITLSCLLAVCPYRLRGSGLRSVPVFLRVCPQSTSFMNSTALVRMPCTQQARQEILYYP